MWQRDRCVCVITVRYYCTLRPLSHTFLLHDCTVSECSRSLPPSLTFFLSHTPLLSPSSLTSLFSLPLLSHPSSLTPHLSSTSLMLIFSLALLSHPSPLSHFSHSAQIFDDPSNFFILDLAGPTSDTLGVSLSVQVRESVRNEMQ